MTLLYPLALLLLPLAFGILYLHGRRERRLLVAGLGLWSELALQGAAASPARAWPRPGWPLALQLLAFLCLVLALARPFWGDGPIQRHWIIVADNSALTAPADLTTALARIEAQAPPGLRVSLVTTNAVARPALADAAIERGLLGRAVADGTGEGAPDWDGALRLARDMGAGDPGNRLLIVASAAPEGVAGHAESVPLPARALPTVVLATANALADGIALSGQTSPDAGITLEWTDTTGDTFLLEPLAADENGSFAAVLPLTGGGILRLGAGGPPTTFVLRSAPAPWRIAGESPVWMAAFADLGAEEAVANADLTLTVPEDLPAAGVALILPAALQPGPFHITDWLADHDLAHGIDWPGLVLDAAAPFVPTPDEIVLLATGEGALMAVGPRHIRLGFDPAQSNAADLLPLMMASRILDWMGPARGGVLPQCLIGQSCQLDRALVGQVLTGPDGSIVPAVAPEIVLRRAGIYTADGRPVLTVNPAPVSGVTQTDLPEATFAADLAPGLIGLALALLSVEAALAYSRGARRGLIPRGFALATLAVAVVNPLIPGPAGSLPHLTVADHRDSDTAAQLELAAARLAQGGTLELSSRALPEDLAAPLARLVGQGVAVTVVPTETPVGDIALSAVTMPETIYAGDRVLVAVSQWSAAAGETAASLTLHSGDDLLASARVTLVPGPNRFDLPVNLSLPGLTPLTVTVDAEGDPEPGNNLLTVYRDIRPAPRIAVFGNYPGPREEMAQMLAAQGFDATPLAPGRMPVRADVWDRYDAALLLGLPAITLEMRQMELLAERVRSGVTGLVIAGGPQAFGPGGYVETPLDDLSPLGSRLPHDGPEVAVVFVLDRSGSMTQTVGAMTRLDLARIAVTSAAGLMDPDTAQLGVVMFGSEAELVLPLGPLPDATGIDAALGRVQAGGGTNIHPGLLLALEELRRSSAEARHIVVMTDGMSEEADFPGLLAAIRAEGVTVSSVAIGSTAETNIAEDIAVLGGGRFHSTGDFAALPSILAQETLMLRGDVIETGPFAVSVEAPSGPVASPVAGLDPAPVLAVVQTVPKPGASPLLSVIRPDDEPLPLLAQWRVGAGRVVALATALTGRWTEDWQATETTPALTAALLRQVLPDNAAPLVTRRGDLWRLTVAADRLSIALEGGEAPALRPIAGGAVTVGLPVTAGGDVLRLTDTSGAVSTLAVSGTITTALTLRDHSAALAATLPPVIPTTSTLQFQTRRGGLIALALVLFLFDLSRRYGLIPAATRLPRKG